ncbi:arginase family protein [Leucobacter sp. CSA1]|uniref:Arginase family protein n=1 Tax=Leucobacter chromiisoli TaxID=2796471 RepID=A0A934Q725_9MICO|nr:arginase family protein [Leucobacter chromiisoli]MBK0418931.1 arginase family protein [Leucobacter chromiisoli]
MPRPAYLVMPQWQGSPSTRAMQLIEGANALREDLPSSARHEVSVPLEAGDGLGTPVARLSSVLRSRDAATEIIDGIAGPAISLGGDCASTLAGLQSAVAGPGADGLAVLWFDAHADLQHPSTSPSGAAAGMALRHALGDGVEDLAFDPPVSPDAVTLVGVRALDAEEDVELRRLGLRTIEAGERDAASAVRERLAQLGARSVYVHIDLDVLDPSEFRSVHTAVPFGLSIAQLTAAVKAAVQAVPLAGAAICGFAPGDAEAAADDRPTVLRLLGALTAGQERT